MGLWGSRGSARVRMGLAQGNVPPLHGDKGIPCEPPPWVGGQSARPSQPQKTREGFGCTPPRSGGTAMAPTPNISGLFFFFWRGIPQSTQQRGKVPLGPEGSDKLRVEIGSKGGGQRQPSLGGGNHCHPTALGWQQHPPCPPGFRVPCVQHTPGAAQRLQPPCPPGPHAEPGGGVSQPCSPEPGHGRGLHPHPPQQHRGVTQGRGEEAGRRPVVLRPGVVLLSGLLIAPVSVVLFFFPLSLFCSELLSVRRPRTRCFALRVSFRSPFRFAPRFSLCAPFVCFVSCALFPPAHPFLFCTSLFAHSSNWSPFLSALPLGLHTLFSPHALPTPPTARTPLLPTPHPTATPNSGRTPSPHPKPPSTPHSGAQRGAGEERWAHGGPRAINGQLAGSAHHYRERRCGAGGGPPRVPARCPYKPGR